MAVDLPSLNITQAIVDREGRPTALFLRLLQNLNGRSTDSTTALDVSYLTLGPTSLLTNERVLTAGTAIDFADTGAGGTLTVKVEDTAITPGTYGSATQVALVTLDQQGRATSASAVAISIPATAISNSTATGRSILTAANVTAVLSLLGVVISSSGTYTPTLTNTANLDSSTAFQCQYMRVGSVVTVSGRVDVDTTAATTLTTLGISLPIASNIGAFEDCAGTAVANGVVSESAAIVGDAANDRATMQWFTTTTVSHAMFFSFTYRVI